jgi:tetratricopeptide (TPR) repeat protein
MISGKLVPVYHEIARLYLQNDRVADAEKIINEGVEKFSTDDPAAASRLLLHLGEIYKSSNDLDKAAVNYKRVIEMNQKVLDKK